MLRTISVVFLCIVGTVLLSEICLAQAVGTPTRLTHPVLITARQTLYELVDGHPRKEIRQELRQWLDSGRVWISFQSDLMPEEMAIELVNVDTGPVPVQVINPAFIIKPQFFDLHRDRRYKELVIYHSYDRLKNHFTGVLPLRSSIFEPGETIKNRAEYVWQEQFSGVSAEWKLAKELNVESLMPVIQVAVKSFGEQEGFLEGFYRLITTMRDHVHDIDKFIPYWDALYRKELAKLK